MSKFNSWKDYANFARTIMRERRYVHSPEVERFLAAVRDTCKPRLRTCPSNYVFWRAQLGHGWEYQQDADDSFPGPHDIARMKPLADKAREGRANPKGIPCLYVATTIETAVSEVRPWIGSYVSVGAFRTVRELKLVDCSVLHASPVFYFEEPSEDEIDKAVWGSIDRAFSVPVEPTDDIAGYVPTQLLAEVFKSEGYDGVAYKSAFDGEKGYNVALFSIDDARLVKCSLCAIKNIRFEFEEIANPYFVRDTSTDGASGPS
jgi:hypothetical protein